MQVLLVEDNDDIRGNLWELLLKEEFDTDVACNGEEALEILGKSRPRVIVTDLYMPKMNGWDLMKIIKLDSRLSFLPIITMSSIRGTDPPPGTQFFYKPLNLDRFMRAIEIATGRHRRSKNELDFAAA